MNIQIHIMISLLLAGFFIFIKQKYLNTFILFSFYLCTIWILFEVIAENILVILGLEQFDLKIASIIISTMSMFILAIIAKYFIKNYNSLHANITVCYIFNLLLVPLETIYYMHLLSLITSKHKEYTLFTIISGIFLIQINCNLCKVYNLLRRVDEIRRENLLYRHQLNLCSQYAAEKEMQNYETRKFHHDIENHLARLLGLILAEKFEEASKDIASLLKLNNTNLIKGVCCSGNIVIDSLINYKYILAHKEAIDFHVNVAIPVTLPFQNEAITIVLGNLLENALDACRQQKKEKPFINLSISYKKGILFITLLNTYKDKRIRDRQGHFRTTKERSVCHGLGLNLVEAAIKVYHGTMKLEAKNGIFKTIIIMYEE